MSLTVRSITLFVVTVFSVMIFSTSAAARSADQPVPLRVMYLQSDLVFAGTISHASRWMREAQIDGSAIYSRTLTISVEAPIKGHIGSGEVNVTENYISPGSTGDHSGGDTGAKSNFVANGERRIFFISQQQNLTYFLLSNYHGDLALNNYELEVYVARLRELHNIYLSGGSKEQLIDWLSEMAADPITRFDGAYDLANALGRESGTSLDPSGRPEGSSLDPNGKLTCRDSGSCVDPDGKLTSGDSGSGIDPDGKSLTEEGDVGSRLDPNGKKVKPAAVKHAKGEQGPSTDPDGRAKGEQGPSLDPDGRNLEQGPGIDPDGKVICLAKGDAGCGMDPDGKSSVTGKDDGRGIDPNGKGLGVDPNGKSSIFRKDDGRGIDPNGRGAGIDPDGAGSAMDPNGRGVQIDPNGKTGDDKDAGPRIDPEGRLANKAIRNRESGTSLDPNGRGPLIDPDGRGFSIDPNGKSSVTGKDDGRGIDSNGKDLGVDPNGNAQSEAGVIIDPNGRTGDDTDSGPRIDPNGRTGDETDAGPRIDPEGRGAGLDPNGRSFSGLNREKLIQAFLATALRRLPFSEGDLALLYVVATFHDPRVNIVLAARV